MRLLLFLLLLSPLPLTGQAQPAALSAEATQALFLDGLTRAFLDDPAGAVARFREVLEKVPDQPAVLDALALSYAALGDLPLAQDAADAATRFAPSNSHFALTAARIAEQRGDPRGAETRLETLLRQKPDAIPVLAEQARLLETRGAYADALVLLEKLPPTSETLDRRLALYARAGDDAAFQEAYAIRVRLAPPTATLLRYLGQHHLRGNRSAEARDAFEAALRLDPSDRDARQALATLTPDAGSETLAPGYAAYVAGDFAASARLFQSDLDRDAGDVLRWAAAAMAHLEAGDAARAATLLDDARLIFFDAPTLSIPSIYAALLDGDVDAAAALFDGVDEDAPPLHKAALLLAEAAVRKAQGNAADAARLQAEAFALAPLDALRASALAPAGGALQVFLP